MRECAGCGITEDVETLYRHLYDEDGGWYCADCFVDVYNRYTDWSESMDSVDFDDNDDVETSNEVPEYEDDEDGGIGDYGMNIDEDVDNFDDTTPDYDFRKYVEHHMDDDDYN